MTRQRVAQGLWAGLCVWILWTGVASRSARFHASAPERSTRETFRHQLRLLRKAARSGDRDGSFGAALLELRWLLAMVEMHAELGEPAPELNPERLMQVYDQAVQRAAGAEDHEKLRLLQERYDAALRLLTAPCDFSPGRAKPLRESGHDFHKNVDRLAVAAPALLPLMDVNNASSGKAVPGPRHRAAGAADAAGRQLRQGPSSIWSAALKVAG